MTGDHVKSWYAATAHAAPERLALSRDRDAEICVIGGGFSGLAAALMLAERGRSVVLLEANRIGWGASGRNGGQILAGWSGEGEMLRQLGDRGAEFLMRTKYRGHEIIENWIDRYAIDCDYRHGAVTVSANAKQQRTLEEEYEDALRRQQAGHLELVDARGLRAHVATEAYLGGLIDRRGAHCHPLNLCLEEARAAETAGVHIFENTEALDVRHGASPVVRATGGEINARFVILAGNAYHRLEQEQLGGYMLPAQTFVITTEPLRADRADEILPTNLAVADANWVLDYFRRTSDDRLLFGGRCTYSNRSIADIEAALRPRLLRVLPQLRGVKIDYAWGGAIGIPLNRVPLIGRVGGNIYYMQGYSGHGVNCSHIAAEMIADAVDAKMNGLDLFESVRHFRIPAARVVGNPMLALGMTWFRMRDALGV